MLCMLFIHHGHLLSLPTEQLSLQPLLGSDVLNLEAKLGSRLRPVKGRLQLCGRALGLQKLLFEALCLS